MHVWYGQSVDTESAATSGLNARRKLKKESASVVRKMRSIQINCFPPVQTFTSTPICPPQNSSKYPVCKYTPLLENGECGKEDSCDLSVCLLTPHRGLLILIVISAAVDDAIVHRR